MLYVYFVTRPTGCKPYMWMRQLAHKNFLFKTVHGGEDWGPESIFQVGDTCIESAIKQVIPHSYS